MPELNAGSAGGLLHHETAPGTEIQRGRIQDQNVTGSEGGKATSTKPASPCQSQPANPIPAASKIARLSLHLMTPAE